MPAIPISAACRQRSSSGVLAKHHRATYCFSLPAEGALRPAGASAKPVVAINASRRVIIAALFNSHALAQAVGK
jgi:hypothetical protein